MPVKTIDQFMWGYQEHLRIHIQSRLKAVFEALGINLKPDVYLIGVRKDNPLNPYSVHAVCIEPEKGPWTQAMFSNMHARVNAIKSTHPMQNTFHSAKKLNDLIPERMHRDSVRTTIRESVEAMSDADQYEAFVGIPYPIEDYYVTPVVRIINEVFDIYPKLQPAESQHHETLIPTLVHSVVKTMFGELSVEMQLPVPGDTHYMYHRSAQELARDAADNYFRRLVSVVCEDPFHGDAFKHLSEVSALLYEGATGHGRMLFVKKDDPRIHWDFKFQEPVPLSDARWVRKTLQVTSSESLLVCNGSAILGFGRIGPEYGLDVENYLEIDFVDRFSWEVWCGGRMRMSCKQGMPQLPLDLLDHQRFLENYKRIFPTQDQEVADKLWKMVSSARRNERACMIVVAKDAAEEARRLEKQGTMIQPTPLTEALLLQVSGIDGSILLDPDLNCHAVGVILDGPSHPRCTPARGSRYNSAIRYVYAEEKKRLAIVLSEDRTFEFIPLLRAQVNREQFEEQVGALERADLNSYNGPRLWLDDHRFYATRDQCARINAALDRIENLPKDVGEIVLITNRFQADPEMNESYYDDYKEPE
ncbi:MAG TPA: hypothetical protein VF651_06275 [Gammaproteobacteria bacterium]